jgi:Rhs element Vgr protein
MAKTPLSGDIDLITFSILAEGTVISDLYPIHSLETSKEVNKIPFARIMLYDGDPAEADFEISNKDTFLPGKAIEIKAGYDNTEKSIFKGIIVKHSIEIKRSGESFLILDVMDKALKMTLTRKNDLFPKIKDGELIGKLITANGLSQDVAATTTVYEQIVQYDATDWDLMMMRAEINGLLVTVEGGKVTAKKPDTSQSPVLELTFGDSILDFNADMDAATQLDPSAVKGYSWNDDTLELTEGKAGTVGIDVPGNVSPAKLADVFGIKNYPLQSGGNIDQPSLAAWATAGVQKSQLSRITGQVKFQGNADVLPGKMITLTGVGNRFNGNAFVSAVFHYIEGGNWITAVHFGMAFKWFADDVKNIAAPSAAGQLPPVKGLLTGIVKKVDSDPNGEFRVLVNIPLFQNKSKSIWTRMGTLYANKKTGFFFYPELEDEVIIAFLNEDPRYPVILGCLYSKKMTPPFTPDAQNNKKAIVTREKLQILFDDKDKIIEINTPGGHSIKMDDKSGALSIKDNNKNTVSLSKGGVSIESGGNLKISAKGNITMEASGNMSLAAKANVTIDGAQISNTAKTKFSAKGNLTAELTASGVVTVKGVMVKIN